MVHLSRLLIEWRNRQKDDYYDSDRLISMRALEEKLLALKDEKSYVDVWMELATGEVERHAHSDEYVTRLLYLVDERCIPVSQLQHTVGLQLGHLFRTFDRAGVDFRAHTTSIGTRVRHGYWYWPCHVYLDPLNGSLLYGGQRYPLPEGVEVYRRDDDAEVWADEDGDQAMRDDYLGLLDLPDEPVPAPIYPGFREPVTLPRYRGLGKRER